MCSYYQLRCRRSFVVGIFEFLEVSIFCFCVDKKKVCILYRKSMFVLLICTLWLYFLIVIRIHSHPVSIWLSFKTILSHPLTLFHQDPGSEVRLWPTPRREVGDWTLFQRSRFFDLTRCPDSDIVSRISTLRPTSEVPKFRVEKTKPRSTGPRAKSCKSRDQRNSSFTPIVVMTWVKCHHPS